MTVKRFAPFKNVLLAAAFIVPTNSLSGWRLEKFNHIKPNSVSADQSGLTIKVDSSASPLIYKLSSPILVSSFNVSGKFRGLPSFSDTSKQGQKSFDDYALRVGFVIPGPKKLTGIKKIFAAEWVKHLSRELPSGAGLDYIQFFDVTQNPRSVGQERISPSSNLIHEKIFASVEKAGPFRYRFMLPSPIKAAAIWISVDGDDTKSKFTVLIHGLMINGAENQ